MAKRGRPRSFEREDALRKAMNVFWLRGYEGATISELTHAMGINSPSLYGTFGSKEDLFSEAVELYKQTDGAFARQGFNAAATAKSAIIALLETNAICIATHKEQPTTGQSNIPITNQPTGCMIVLSALHDTNETHTVYEQLINQRHETEVLLYERLLRGIQDKEISAQVDISIIAKFYVTILHGMSIQARDGATRDALLITAKQAILAWDTLISNQPT